MAPAHLRFQLLSGSQPWLGASLALLAVGSAVWLGLHAPRGVAADPSSRQAAAVGQDGGTAGRRALTAAQRARAAQTHLQAVRTHELALRQRGNLPEDQALWEYALASSMRAVYSVRHAPGGEQLSPQIKTTLAQLAAYAELVSAPVPRQGSRSHAGSKVGGPGTAGAAEAAERLDAAWQELQNLASRHP